MEKEKLLFPLDLQLFAEDKKGTSGDDVDPDEVLNKMTPKNVDDDSDDDIYEDDIEDEEDEDEYSDDEDEEDEDSDSDDEEDDDDSDKSKTKEKGEPKKENQPATDETNKAKPNPDPKTQNRDVNHEQKLLRQQKEAEEKARRENFQKGFIAALGGVNPYTGGKIENDDDIHEAQVMIEAKKRGLDPIQDYSKMDKILRSEERVKAQELADKENAEKEARAKDFKDFAEAYPDVDIAKLFNEDKDFLEFANDLVGNVPLTKVYALYLKTQQKAKNVAADKKDMEDARRQSTPGSASSGGEANGDYYTLAELKKLSPSEVKANFRKVERSYERINGRK